MLSKKECLLQSLRISNLIEPARDDHSAAHRREHEVDLAKISSSELPLLNYVCNQMTSSSYSKPHRV